jgi:uncharacterized protein (DUF885 family)
VKPQTVRLLRPLAALVALTRLALPAAAQTKPAPWIEKSNQNARVMLQVLARFGPEGAGQLGVPGLDEEIFDLKPRLTQRAVAATREAVATLKQRLETEEDPAVRQDLEILIQAGEQNVEGTLLAEKYQIPYFDLPHTVFRGIRALLDDQVEPSRRGAALVRLKRYAGVEQGYTPIAELAKDRIRERLPDKSLQAPFRDEVERDLGNADSFMDGIAKLFQKYSISGWEEPHAKLKRQIADYTAFLRAELLPRARSDFRQPPELYAFSLKQVGIDMPLGELVRRAEVAFREIQNEMQAIALLLAKERGWKSSDYRDAVRELKKAQLVGEAILPHYRKRIQEIEEIIRREKIVTLPGRDARIRLASEAESAAIPAPHMRPPRLIENTGEMGEFVLPLRIPGKAGAGPMSFDDFTNEAASWTLTAHEARPGHEMQFASIVEKGVSIARAIFAFNSVNAEGWGLYAESEMKPYLPLDGQLMALQHRLLRAARAILDPGLQAGTFTREEATRVLREEVVLSDAMALQEVQRYTFLAPGQATAYFCGYSRLMELRTEAEQALGKSFDRQKYHDFVLAQGLLPPRLVRKAVFEEFIPARKKPA